MRLDLDVRRHWQCPACGTERHTSGQVTFVRCHFCKDHRAMSLIEQPRPPRTPSPPLDLIIDLHPDDVDAPAFVPFHLREPEPAATAETIAEILTEPPVDADRASELTAAAVVAEPEEAIAELSADEATPEEASKPKKKKRRGRRQRRRDRSNQSTGEGNSAQQAGAISAADDASFGAGFDS
jgi:hypothetical protein